IQGSDKGWLENSACLGVKNIGKPCALIAHARFDEGGQARACPLLYLCVFFFFYRVFFSSQNDVVFFTHGRFLLNGLSSHRIIGWPTYPMNDHYPIGA
ncbi:MAG: hypothetical protein Q7U66_11415, partial [Methylobacter sp.]|nr:hypothetical protein [Methylobacter sp.]